MNKATAAEYAKCMEMQDDIINLISPIWMTKGQSNVKQNIMNIKIREEISETEI